MTHLTAMNPASGSVDRIEEILAADRKASELLFYSPTANSLELNRGTFHYSVIKFLTPDTLAPGLGDRHISFDVSAAPNGLEDTAGARAWAGDK